jgi:hypothetical protein
MIDTATLTTALMNIFKKSLRADRTGLRKLPYWGCPKKPTEESWAFAFSCKKKWKEKAKSDSDKISKHDRTFTTVFFISNQFIRDKVRSPRENYYTNVACNC